MAQLNDLLVLGKSVLLGSIKSNADHDLMYHGNEFTFASPGHSGDIYINYRTGSGEKDGAITGYRFADGAGNLAPVYGSTFYGSFSGTASSATALTSSAGSATLPVYFSAGKPVVITDLILTTTASGDKKVQVGNSNGLVELLASTNRGVYDRTKYTWIIYGTQDGTHTYVPRWASKGTSTLPVYFNSNGEPVACGTSLAVSITGNAATATALTSNAGSATLPIYFSGGKPVACNTTLEVSISGNAATATIARKVENSFDRETSNYKDMINFFDSDGSTVHQYIGGHNTGSTNGAIIINPAYDTTTNKWDTGGGLYVGATSLYWNGKSHAVNSAPTLSWGATATIGTVFGTALTLTMPTNPNTDTKVTQSSTTTSNFRPIILGVTNSTDTSTLANTATGQVYASTKFYAQPSTGQLYATTFVGALSGKASSATIADTVVSVPNSALPLRLRAAQSSGFDDANEAVETGFHYMTTTATNRPSFVGNTTNKDYRILTTAYSSIWLQQIATDFRCNEIYYRRCQNGTWKDWVEIPTFDNVLNNTSVGASGWVSGTAKRQLINHNTLAYWNGAYSGTSSNLAYCAKGAFGTIITRDATDYLRYYDSNSEMTTTETVGATTYLHTVSTSGGQITTTTKPSGIDNAWGVLHMHLHSGNYAMQLGFGGTTGNLYMRNAYASATFGDWRTILDTGNYTTHLDGRYVNASGDTMSGTLNMNNNQVSNIGDLTFADPGANEGITWTGGNGWYIYESPDDLTNAAGNLQFVHGSTRRLTINTSGQIDVNGVLKLANGTWNLAGDDAYFGDNNTAGSFAIKGANGNTNLKMVTYNNTTYGTITWNGSQFILDKKLQIGNSTQSGMTNAVGIHVHDLRSTTITPDTFGDQSVNFIFHNSLGTSDWRSAIHVKGWTGSYVAWELSGGASTAASNKLYYREGVGTTWGSWYSIPFENRDNTFTGTFNSMLKISNGESVTSGTTAGTRNSLIIYGTTYGNDSTYIKTAGKFSYGDPGPQIIFGTNTTITASQKIALIYTDHDSIATGNSLSLVSTETNASFIAPTIKALTKFVGDLDGNATTAFYPYGFASFTSGATWGNTTGTSIASWNDSTGGSVDWRRDNPSSGKISMKVDGRVYVNEGSNPVMGMTYANGFWGMGSPDGEDNVWIRTTSLGIIPYQSGGLGSGHNSLGTSTWYFSNAYIDTVNSNTTYAYNWFRSYNATGWYNETYQGGIYMADSTWVQVYNKKNFKATGQIFAYAYGNQGNNAPAFILDKNGSYYTGIGSINTTDTIYFGAVDSSTFAWNTSYQQKWRFNGEVQALGANAFRLVQGNYGIILRNDGSDFYFLTTASADQYGTWSSLRPFAFNLTSGRVSMSNGVNIGYTNTSYTLSTASFICNSWVRTVGDTGWYSQTYGCHIRPNTLTTYGGLRVHGNVRGGYEGIHLGTSTSYMTVMSSDVHQGLYNEANARWLFYYNKTYDHMSIGYAETNDSSYILSVSGNTYLNGTNYSGTLYSYHLYPRAASSYNIGSLSTNWSTVYARNYVAKHDTTKGTTPSSISERLLYFTDGSGSGTSAAYRHGMIYSYVNTSNTTGLAMYCYQNVASSSTNIYYGLYYPSSGTPYAQLSTGYLKAPMFVVTTSSYGTSLPTATATGQIFFKLV